MRNVLLLVAMVMFASPFGLAFADDAKKETVSFTVVDAGTKPAEVAPSGAVAIPVQPAAPAVDEAKAKVDAENAALIKAQEEKKLQEITEPPGWLKGAIAFAMKVPYIGPIAVQILQWMGVLAALLTALAGVMLALMKIFAKLGKSVAVLSKAKDALDKLYPWVAYLSMFNISVAKNDDKSDASKTA